LVVELILVVDFFVSEGTPTRLNFALVGTAGDRRGSAANNQTKIDEATFDGGLTSADDLFGSKGPPTRGGFAGKE
jgi:hypothetical protein